MIKNKIVLGVITAVVAVSMAVGLTSCSECEHEFDDGTIITTGDCQHTGTIEYTCKICGYTKDEPYLGEHQYDYENGTIITPATCGEDGKVEYRCTVCNKKYTEVIEATGEHTWKTDYEFIDEVDADGWYTNTPAEKYADGVARRECSVCGKIEEKAIHTEGEYNDDHDFDEAIYYEADEESDVITEDGWYTTCNHFGCDKMVKVDDDESDYDFTSITYLVDDANTLTTLLSDSDDISIKLNNDIDLTEALSISADDVTIDLNGKNITTSLTSGSLITVGGVLNLTDSSRKANGSITFEGDEDEDSSCIAIEVQEDGELDIDAGVYTGDIAVKVDSGADATIEGGTFIGTGASTIQTAGSTYIDNGTFTNSSENGVVLDICGGSGSDDDDDDADYGTTIDGGTFTAASNSAVTVSNNATVGIGEYYLSNSDVKITSSAGCGIEVAGGTVDVFCGTIKGLGSNGTGIGIVSSNDSNASSVSVYGGIITGTAYGISTDASITSEDLVTVTIDGGKISANTGVYLAANGECSISDGTIIGKIGVEIQAGSLTVSGGTVSGSNSESGAGIAVKQNSSGSEISVTITSGTISGYYSVHESGATNKDNITISINEGEANLKGIELLEDFQDDTAEEEGDDSSSDGEDNSSSSEGTDETPSDGTGDGEENNGTESGDSTGTGEGEGEGDDNEEQTD